MDGGLLVHLNPQGGNQLNVREVLRLLHPVGTESSDDASAGDEPQDDGRRGVGDDYDYDDDFIDDDDLVEEDMPPVDEPHNENAHNNFVPAQPESEEALPDAVAAERSRKQKAVQAATVHHGFGRFFVNRGEIPPVAKLRSPPNPPTSVGNVTVELPKVQDTPISYEQEKIIEDDQEKSNPDGDMKSNSPFVQEQENGVGTGASTVAQKKKVTEGNAVGTVLKEKSIPPRIATEITTLAELCRTEFGEKKPKIQDPKVQDQLAVIFREALAAGVARLYSDIAKDKRIVQLSDDIWIRLSRFLRTKRATLEALGHALHWRSREIEAKQRVEASEQAIDTVVGAQRTGWVPADTGQSSPERPVEWTSALGECMYEWYSARSELQTSKNQLGARVRSVKKSLPMWVSALKARSFSGFTVTEQEIIDAFRRIEDERAAKERQKRELERLERKRKKEEAAAAVAAKRQATASTKSIQTSSSTGTGANSSTTASPPQKSSVTTPPPKPPLPKGPKPVNVKKEPKATLVKSLKPGSRQGSPLSNSHKQAKLTSLIKKPSKDGSGVLKKVTSAKQVNTGGNGSVTSKNSPSVSANPKNSSSASSSTTPKVAKQPGAVSKPTGYTKPVVAARSTAGLKPPNPAKMVAQGKVQSAGKSPSAKTTTPIKSHGKNSTGKNAITKVTSPQGKSTTNKPLSNKPTPNKQANDKSTANKPAANKPAANKPIAAKQVTTKPALAKSSSKKASVGKPVGNKAVSNKPTTMKSVSNLKLGALLSTVPINDTKSVINPGPIDALRSESVAKPASAPKQVSESQETGPPQQSSKAHKVSVAQLVLQDEPEEVKPIEARTERDGAEGVKGSREFEVIELD